LTRRRLQLSQAFVIFDLFDVLLKSKSIGELNIVGYECCWR
jgi:hypothetical protein